MHKASTLFLIPLGVLLFAAPAMSQNTIAWHPTVESAKRVAGETNRLVLIHFWADWCQPCKKMEREVLSQPRVAAVVNAQYIPVKVNQKDFPATCRRYGVTSLPSDIIITPQGDLVGHFKGMVGLEDYIARLNHIASTTQRHPPRPQAPAPGNPPRPAPTQMASAQPHPGTYRPDNYRPGTYHPGNYPPPNPGYSPQPASAPNYTPPMLPAPNAAQNRPPQNRPQNQLPQNPLPNHPRANYQPPAMHQQPSAMAHRPQPMQPNPPVTRNVVPASAMAPSVAPTARAPKSPAASPTVPPSSNPQLGFDGYCPVQLHDDMRSKNMRWTPGDARWGVIHRGRTYLFSGEDQQRRFLADPDRYAPVLSGNDIVLAIDKGQMVPGRREHGVLYEDHIYLFSNEGTLKAFAQNRSHYARLALQAMATDAQRQRAMQ